MCTGISPLSLRGETRGLTVALNGDVGKANQCFAPWAVWNDLKGLDGLVGFFFCTLTRPFQRSADCHGFQYRFQKMAAISLLNRFTDHLRLVGRSVTHGVEQRQGRFAFVQVIAHVFAERLAVRTVVQQIINQLEGRTQIAA